MRPSPDALTRRRAATALVTAVLLDDAEAVSWLLTEGDQARAAAATCASWYARSLQCDFEEHGGLEPLELLRQYGLRLATENAA
jgi:hypothetical protein